MKLKCLTLVVLMLCLLAGTAMAATVGKITGVISDSQTKEPLIGVSVSVVGTTMGAMTNENGQYSILNVPVGTYMLRLSAVGYATVEISNVEVSADLATYQNEVMSSQATDIGKVIQVTTERPLIIKDQTSQIAIVKREELLALPTRGFEQVVGIQTGVVKMNPNPATRFRGGRESTTTGELNIRGGRPSEVAYYVDGFSQQDPLSGNSTANISNNAIKEVSIISGGFPAEYGHVSSGIVNTITQSGSEKLHGNAEIVSDGIFPDNFDNNFYSLDLSGPIPILEKLFFFASVERRWHGDRQPSAIAEELFQDFNVSTEWAENPQRLPRNTMDGWSYQGKVDYNFTPNVKLQLSGNGSRDKWSEYRHDYLFDAEHMPYYDDKNIGLNAKITHTLNAKTFYNLSTSYFMTSRFRGDGVHRDDLWAYGRPQGNTRFDETSLFWLWDDPTTDWSYQTVNVNGVDRQFIINDESSIWDDYFKRKSSYIGFKGDINSELNDRHTVKAGFEFQRHTLRYYRHLFPANVWKGLDAGGFDDVDRFGYDIYGNESNDEGEYNETKHPINVAFYVQDRAEFEGLIINAGLRFDYFNYNTKRLRNEDLPLDPDSTYFDSDPNNDLGYQTLEPSDLTDSKNFTRVSPRIGIAFPVSDKTNMHLNYGKFYQRPDLVRLYTGFDYFEYKVKNGGYFYPIGNPNLEPELTTQYEVGINHQLGERTAFEVIAFLKDVSGLVQVTNQPSQPNSFSFYRNSDYGTVKGLEFNFTMRRTHNLEMNLKYTLSYATGTGSYANTASNIAWTAAQPPKQVAPLDFDQRHNLIGIFDWRLGKGQGPVVGGKHILEDFGINTVVQIASGTPFTPADIFDEVTLASVSPNPRAPRNTSYGPGTFNIDLKAEKTFTIGNYKLSPYIWVKNLLDRDNAYVVYEGSGRADVTNWLQTDPGQDFIAEYSEADETGLTGEQKYMLKQRNPQNYGNPRMILAGLRFSF